MEVEGAIGSKAAFAEDAVDEGEALDGVALAVDELLLFAALFDAVDLDLDFDEIDEDDFFEEDFGGSLLRGGGRRVGRQHHRSRERGHERHDAEHSSSSHGSASSKSNAVESCQRMHRRVSPDEFRQSHLC